MARKEKQVQKQLIAHGWTLVSEKKHQKWHCSCGQHTLIVSTSQGRGRASQNLRAVLKRQGDCGFDLKWG